MEQQTQTTTPQAPQTDQKVQAPAQAAPDTATAPKQDELAAKFAALAKKERIARQQAQRVKQLEAQIAERERQIAERERQWDEEFKKSPLEAIKRRGYTYEDLTKAALNDGKFQPETEIKEVRSEIERLRMEQAEKEKKALEAQKKAEEEREQQVVAQFKSSISEHIEANKDKYELTALYDASDLVFQTIEEHFLRTQKMGKPKIMSLDEACELVEKFYEEELERTASSSKKFKSKFKIGEGKEDQKSQSKTSTTLTNDMTPSSTAPSLLPASTEEARLKRALAALG